MAGLLTLKDGPGVVKINVERKGFLPHSTSLDLFPYTRKLLHNSSVSYMFHFLCLIPQPTFELTDRIHLHTL